MVDNKSIIDTQGETIPCQEISDKSVLIKSPLVSAHMITYNHEPYIAQAIEGVLQQKTDFPFELIIGEDCSTDRTREIVLEYQKKNPAIIRVLISASNVGGHKNSRRVSAACRGKYMAYCEGDDYWHNPLKLKKQVEYLELHPDVGMIHSDIDWYFTDKKKKLKRVYMKHMSASLPRTGTSLIHEIVTANYVVATCSVIARRLLIEQIQDECQYEFSEKFLMGDTQTWIELAHRTRLAFLPESLSTYNIMPESASRSKDLTKYYNFTKNAFEMRLYYISKYGGTNTKKIETIVVQKRINLMLGLAYQGRSIEWADEALTLAQRQNIRFNMMNVLHYYGSKNWLFYYLVRTVLLPTDIAYKFLYEISKATGNLIITCRAICQHHLLP
jgi:glycosyltransferase involved in cell wall biosynthesis